MQCSSREAILSEATATRAVERAETIPSGSRGQAASKCAGSTREGAKVDRFCGCGQKVVYTGKMLCRRCYHAAYKRDHAEQMNKLARAHYAKNREKILARSRHRHLTDESYRKAHRKRVFESKYAGNGVKALRTAGFKCSECGYEKVAGVLVIHHRDGDRSNNKLSNLQVLCPTCHCEKHWQEGHRGS